MPVNLNIENHSETITFDIISCPSFEIVLGLPWLERHNPLISWDSGIVEFNSPVCLQKCSNPEIGKNLTSLAESVLISGIQIVPDDEFTNEDTQPVEQDPLFVAATIHESIHPLSAFQESEEETQHLPDPDFSSLPAQYHDLAQVFNPVNSDILPEHRPFDLSIDLVPNSTIPVCPIYPLNLVEEKTLKEYIEDMLKKKFIQPSKSPAGAPVLFVPKSDGFQALC